MLGDYPLPPRWTQIGPPARELAGDGGESWLPPTPGLPSLLPEPPCFCSPGKARDSTRVSHEGIGFQSRRNRFMPCIPSNKSTGLALSIRCASLSNCPRIPLPKLTRGGASLIVSPSDLPATLAAPALFPSPRLRRATGCSSRTSRGRRGEPF